MPKQEEWYVGNTAESPAEGLDFCIERLRNGIGGTAYEVVKDGVAMVFESVCNGVT